MMHPARIALVAAVLLLPCAAHAADTPFARTLAAVAPAPDENSKASAFFERAFDEDVLASPEFATQLGLKYGSDRWSPINERESLASAGRARRHLQELRDTIDRSKLDAQGQLSYDIFERDEQRGVDGYEWRYHRYLFDQMNGLQSSLPAFLINAQRVESVADAESYVARLRAVAARTDQALAWVTEAERRGILPPKFVFRYVISDARNVVAGAPFSEGEDSPLWHDFRTKVESLQVDDATRSRLLAEGREAMLAAVKPSYEKVIAWAQAAEKRATTDDGVWKLPDGRRYYDYLLRQYTTSTMTADEIHRLGLSEVKRIQGEMRAIMKQVGFRGDLQAFYRFMQEDPRFYYPDSPEGRAEYTAAATRVIDDLKRRLPELFRTLPKADIVVKAVEPFREKSAAKAFYERPSEDGRRPGVYYANLYRMQDMPKYQMEVLAYHEGVPGHHMQIAIASELADLPRFRRFASFTAYSEGWGLYSERTPKELGMYADPYSDFGRLALELERAVRLVTDTGLHAKRWTRERSIRYHMDVLPMTRDAAIKATERYIVLPGQATAYTIGMLKIVQLREKATRELGPKFDVRDFHDVVLRSGALPLDLLERQVDAWIVATRSR
jgi:uncharacterized protein (DUF885 family)